MARSVSRLLAFVLIVFLYLSSGVEGRAQSAAAETLSSPTLRAHTPIQLRLKKNLRRDRAIIGAPAEFEVVEDVVVNGQVVIPTGAVVNGRIRQVDQTGKEAATVVIDLEPVRAISGEVLRLAGEGKAADDASLGRPTLKDVGGMVSYSPEIIPALPVVLPVLAVMGLFPGKKLLLHRGVLYSVYVSENVPLDTAKLQAAQGQLADAAKPKDDIPEEIVSALESSGDLDAQITAVKWLSGISPNEIRLHYELGRLLLKKNEPDAAIAELQWVSGNEKYPLANCEMGRALELKGDLKAALGQYRLALQSGVHDEQCHSAHERLQLQLGN